MGYRRFWTLTAIVLGAVSLIAPALLVGHPDVFPDTSAYELIGQWFIEQLGVHPHGGFGYLRHRADLKMFFTIAGARSPLYGMLLFAVSDRGSAWAMIALQALSASALIALTLRVVLGRWRLIEYAIVIGLLTLASTLPFFVSFVMPDVFLGLGALTAILMLFYFEQISQTQRWALGAGLALTLSFHATNAPAVLSLTLVAAAAIWLGTLPGRPARQGLAVVLGCAGLSLVIGALYPWTVERLSHRELSRPPFLSARLLADGPGRDYLQAACAKGTPFVLCAYQNRPMTDANSILWSTDRRRGIFETANYPTRLAMTKEEPRFVAAAVRAEPLRTAWLLVRDSAFELTDVSVLDTLGYGDHGLIAKGPRFSPILPGMLFCVRRPSYCNSTPFQLVSEDVLRWSLIGAVLYIGVRLACAVARVRVVLRLHPLPPRLAAAACGVFVLLLADAVICGALSGVYPRYEMRIAWLAPLFAALAWLQSSPFAAVGWSRRAATPAMTPAGAQPQVLATDAPTA